MKHILVVDDEKEILETIVNNLEIEFEPSEVKIHIAINGIEALKILNGDIHFDLVVTDLNMPEMDGIELAKKIMAIKDRKLPVIVFSGHGDLEEEAELNDIGVLAMIKKPYVEELVDRVTLSLG